MQICIGDYIPSDSAITSEILKLCMINATSSQSILESASSATFMEIVLFALKLNIINIEHMQLHVRIANVT